MVLADQDDWQHCFSADQKQFPKVILCPGSVKL
jgi:hypothetical protein